MALSSKGKKKAREIQVLRKALLVIISEQGVPVSRLHERTIQLAADKRDLEMLRAFANHTDKDTPVTLIRDVVTVQRTLGVPYEKEAVARDIASCARIKKAIPAHNTHEETLDVYALVIARPMITTAVLNIIERQKMTNANSILSHLRLLVSDGA